MAELFSGFGVFIILAPVFAFSKQTLNSNICFQQSSLADQGPMSVLKSADVGFLHLSHPNRAKKYGVPYKKEGIHNE